jgi:hypothetical protein
VNPTVELLGPELAWQHECFQRIERGVTEVLDVYVPDWPRHIDPTLLSLKSADRCMLGQLARNNMVQLIQNFVNETGDLVRGFNAETARADDEHDYHDRDYDLALRVLELAATERGNDLEPVSGGDWGSIYGFNLYHDWHGGEEPDRYVFQLEDDDLWRILTESWLFVVGRRGAALSLNDEEGVPLER